MSFNSFSTFVLTLRSVLSTRFFIPDVSFFPMTILDERPIVGSTRLGGHNEKICTLLHGGSTRFNA